MSNSPVESIAVGAFAIRFLVEGSQSNGSVAVFECDVPAQSMMDAPHSHDGFEETIYGLSGMTTWKVDDDSVDVGVGEAVCVPRGPSTASQTTATSTRRSSPSPHPASSARRSSARSAPSWPPPGRPTSQLWAGSCSATDSRRRLPIRANRALAGSICHVASRHSRTRRLPVTPVILNREAPPPGVPNWSARGETRTRAPQAGKSILSRPRLPTPPPGRRLVGYVSRLRRAPLRAGCHAPTPSPRPSRRRQ